MAKSLRSKWVRKMKAVKRVRYGEKELATLKTVLKAKRKMKLKKIVDIVYPKRIKTRQKKGEDAPANVEQDGMEVDSAIAKPVYNSSLRDQNGNYPIWLNPRKAKKLAKKASAKGGKKKRSSTW